MTTQTIVEHSDFGLRLTPLSARIGAQIDDVTLSADLTREQIKAIRDALLHYKVIFFRNQDRLDEVLAAIKSGSTVPAWSS
jgi:alpha-ketoglutarate-dependent taurine dioxygenase